MVLSDYNVNEKLEHYFTAALIETPYQFAKLKTYLINQEAIADIHGLVVRDLNQLIEPTKSIACINVQNKMLELQSKEDNHQETIEERDNEAQRQEILRLMTSSATMTAQRDHHQSQINHLNGVIHAHTHANVHTHQNATDNVHTHTNSNVPESPYAQRYRLLNEINALNRGIASNSRTINDLEAQRLQRMTNKIDRSKRQKSHLELLQNKPGVTVEHVLTSKNQKLLKKEVEDAERSIDLNYTFLINQAKSANYPTFLKQLELFLSLLELSPLEKQAVSDVLSLMKKHIEHNKSASALQTKITNTNSTIQSKETQLNHLQTNAVQLKDSIPNLNDDNKTFGESNERLARIETENKKSSALFSKLTLIIGAATLVTAIPLALMLGGILPITIASTTLFILAYAVPGVVAAASLSMGITALIYYGLASSNRNTITKNEHTMMDNINLIDNNQKALVKLESETIPSCTTEIDKLKETKTNTEAELTIEQTAAQDALDAAKQVEPGTAPQNTSNYGSGTNGFFAGPPSAPSIAEIHVPTATLSTETDLPVAEVVFR